MNHENTLESIEEHAKTTEELEAELRERDERIAELTRQLQEKVRELVEKTQEAQKNLEAAVTDGLTTLPNFAGMKRAAKIVMPESIPEGKPEGRDLEQKNKHIALLALDIDGFKAINDQYGHLAGDLLIQEVGAFLVDTFRGSDVVARPGGDEFVVILNGATERIINKFFDHDADPPRPRFGFDTKVGGKQIRISLSGGIALLQPGETIDNFDDLRDRADFALYKSKHAGKDMVTLFHSSDIAAFEEHKAHKTQK